MPTYAAIRLSPELNGPLLTYAASGETFPLLYELDKWYAIDVNGYEAFIYKTVAYTIVEKVPAEEEIPAEDPEIYIVVDATNATVPGRAAIRLTPELNGQLLIYATSGQTFRLLYELDKWYAIDVNDYEAFIHKSVAHITE